MDLSALIFVALAVAWAVYLVPKALKHHEDDDVSRSVDGFSDRLRVVARREAVSATAAELVPAGRRSEPTADGSRPDGPALDAAVAPTPAPRPSRPTTRSAAARAAARRRRVLTALLLALVVVGALAVGEMIAVPWVAVPGGLLLAWLVACRLMVRRERAARAAARVRKRRRTLADEVVAAERQAAAGDSAGEIDDALDDDTGEIPVVAAAAASADRAEVAPDPGAWTPVPVPLPTYVAKEAAGRTVRTIDLDSTGVWSSGRNEADSQLAREADAQRAQAECEAAPADVERRAAGS